MHPYNMSKNLHDQYPRPGRARTSGGGRMTLVDGVKTFEGHANHRENDGGAGIGGKLRSIVCPRFRSQTRAYLVSWLITVRPGMGMTSRREKARRRAGFPEVLVTKRISMT